jgi:uncharacterized Zn finger protein
MSWYYESKPAIHTEQGIKAKSQRGDFVKNWWATRWLAAMERVMDAGRLRRGRTYARKGQVLALEEGKGHMSAKVQGSRPTPYKASIALTPLSDKDWEQVLEALRERPYFVAQLLAGEMPQEIEEAFAAAKLDLFPSKSELKQSCNCPDWADVCKHLAAVHYILAERFDEDPFLLFRLRGRGQEEILAVLGDGTGEPSEGETAVAYAPATPLTELVADFWRSPLETHPLAIQVRAPHMPYPLLERLGTPDFMPQALLTLRKGYERVTAQVVEMAYQAEELTQMENENDGDLG